MAAHAHLKNEFTEDEKYHNLMRWLILFKGIVKFSETFLRVFMVHVNKISLILSNAELYVGPPKSGCH